MSFGSPISDYVWKKKFLFGPQYPQTTRVSACVFKFGLATIYLIKIDFLVKSHLDGEGVCLCVCVGVCGCAVCGSVVCVVSVAHFSIVKTWNTKVFYHLFKKIDLVTG